MLIDPFSLEKYRLVLYGALATIFMGDTDGLLPNVQNGFVVADRTGISWQATKLIQFKLQDDVLSALYDRDLKDMEKPAFQVVQEAALPLETMLTSTFQLLRTKGLQMLRLRFSADLCY